MIVTFVVCNFQTSTMLWHSQLSINQWTYYISILSLILFLTRITGSFEYLLANAIETEFIEILQHFWYCRQISFCNCQESLISIRPIQQKKGKIPTETNFSIFRFVQKSNRFNTRMFVLQKYCQLKDEMQEIDSLSNVNSSANFHAYRITINRLANDMTFHRLNLLFFVSLPIFFLDQVQFITHK